MGRNPKEEYVWKLTGVLNAAILNSWKRKINVFAFSKCPTVSECVGGVT
jgi:hypothetical protein